MTGGVGDRAAKELRRGWEWGSQAATADRAQTKARFLQPQPRSFNVFKCAALTGECPGKAGP